MDEKFTVYFRNDILQAFEHFLFLFKLRSPRSEVEGASRDHTPNPIRWWKIKSSIRARVNLRKNAGVVNPGTANLGTNAGAVNRSYIPAPLMCEQRNKPYHSEATELPKALKHRRYSEEADENLHW